MYCAASPATGTSMPSAYGSAMKSLSEPKEMACPIAAGIPVTAATIADRPSVALGFDRISLIVPSRMSPSVNGRSGMMPGRGASGARYPYPYCPAYGADGAGGLGAEG